MGFWRGVLGWGGEVSDVYNSSSFANTCIHTYLHTYISLDMPHVYIHRDMHRHTQTHMLVDRQVPEYVHI